MKCPHCGHKNPPNTVFCKNCDAWILGNVYTEERPPRRPRRPLPQWARLCLLLCVVALPLSLCLTLLLWPGAPQPSEPAVQATPFWTTEPPGDTLPPITQPPVTEPPISFAPGPAIAESDYILRKGEFICLLIGSKKVLLQNGQIPDTGRNFIPINDVKTNLDGTIGACGSSMGSMYLFDEEQHTPLPNISTSNFVISHDGTVLAYTTMKEKIFIRDLSVDTTVTIDCDSASNCWFTLSPDGQTLVYCTTNYTWTGNDSYERFSTFYLYQNGQSTQLSTFPGSCYPLSVSNDGSLIYLYKQGSGYKAQSGYYAICDQGEPLLLGSPSMIGIPTGSGFLSTSPYCNTDSTQLLYHQSDGTYLSVDGQPVQKLSDQIIMQVSPQLASCRISYTGSVSYIYPHADLRNQVYASREYITLDDDPDTIRCVYTLYHLDAAGTLTQLAADVSEFALDPSGQHLYYLTYGSTLERIDLAENFTPQILDTNVDTFAITYNSSLVYYISANGLYVLQESTGTRVRLTDVMNTPLYVTADNVLHLRIGTTLLSYDPINGVRRTQSNVTDCSLGSSGILYVTTENGTFVYLPASSTWEQINPK